MSVIHQTKENTSVFLLDSVWGSFVFLNNLVRFVPTPGPKDKAFIVPMIHLRLLSPQGCLEEVPRVTHAILQSRSVYIYIYICLFIYLFVILLLLLIILLYIYIQIKNQIRRRS